MTRFITADLHETTRVDRVVRIAAGLMSDDGENPEYDRACVEIVRDVLGLDWEDDTKQELHEYLRWVKTR